MKLSTKIILPLILISALLILLVGCFGIPTDESPGYTPGTITGIIASPCCTTSAEPVSETCCVSPEYWCFYCQKTWSLQEGIEVVLTYGEDEVATTTTNDKGEFTFTNVPPGKNYVITAYCPDVDDNRPLVKD
ncbi:MAG: carboxypeptidase regulatory-like domain-containing protein, partial [Candidatus Lokiarchaeota archaeon]|nr:carboxypeptidase regulatory-like domain-containing protein [Candidatus Lokiarchaeota archaeon]